MDNPNRTTLLKQPCYGLELSEDGKELFLCRYRKPRWRLRLEDAATDRILRRSGWQRGSDSSFPSGSCLHEGGSGEDCYQYSVGHSFRVRGFAITFSQLEPGQTAESLSTIRRYLRHHSAAPPFFLFFF